MTIDRQNMFGTTLSTTVDVFSTLGDVVEYDRLALIVTTTIGGGALPALTMFNQTTNPITSQVVTRLLIKLTIGADTVGFALVHVPAGWSLTSADPLNTQACIISG